MMHGPTQQFQGIRAGQLLNRIEETEPIKTTFEIVWQMNTFREKLLLKKKLHGGLS
jgi:hypothetical protein